MNKCYRLGCKKKVSNPSPPWMLSSMENKMCESCYEVWRAKATPFILMTIFLLVLTIAF